jgi:hypothetical protein
MNVGKYQNGKTMFVLLITIILISGIRCFGQINVYDGFETGRLSSLWSTSRMARNSLEFQSLIVREGKTAVKITLRANDVFEKGKGNSASSERDELMQAQYLSPFEGKKYEYQFSLFLPSDFPIVNTRLVIAQWKQFCPFLEKCSDDSPVLAIRYVGGELYVTLHTDDGSEKLYSLKDEIRNKWLDFKFLIRFSSKNNGEISAFLNNEEIINYKGITSYSQAHGYPAENRYYFKMGLYRDLMSAPMSIYIDEFRMREILN